MTSTRTALGVAVGALTAAGLMLAAGVAAADETTPPAAQEPITLSVEQSVKICTIRIPALLERIDRLQARADAGTGTPGSTAWLTERAEQARSAGRTALAGRLDRRIAERPAKVERLADAESRVVSFRDLNCAR